MTRQYRNWTNLVNSANGMENLIEEIRKIKSLEEYTKLYDIADHFDIPVLNVKLLYYRIRH